MIRRLIVMGSGETSPTMVSLHRRTMADLGANPHAIMLDTPFGFQENADELTEKAQEYFHNATGHELAVASYRRGGSQLELESMLNNVRQADYVFSGPGSPSYALTHWIDTALPLILTDKLIDGGVVTFASAAALTLGSFTIPVYEIYKVGQDPFWHQGLDIMGAVGYPAVIVPHFDNAEGGTHDTRYCWMGRRRFDELRTLLPDGLPVVGIDEHTAWIADLETGSFSVEGRGTVNLMTYGEERVFQSGEQGTLDLLTGNSAGNYRRSQQTATDGSTARAEFESALERGDANALLELILTPMHAAESTDLEVTRSLVARLESTLERGLEDPADTVRPFIELLVDVRERARQDGRWDEADRLRDGLVELGVEVRDTPDGPEWTLGDSRFSAIPTE